MKMPLKTVRGGRCPKGVPPYCQEEHFYAVEDLLSWPVLMLIQPEQMKMQWTLHIALKRVELIFEQFHVQDASPLTMPGSDDDDTRAVLTMRYWLEQLLHYSGV